MAKSKVKTPIDGMGSVKAAKKALTVPKNRDVPLPESVLLAGLKVTAANLRKGTYQQQLLAAFAPFLAPEFLQSLRRSLIAGDAQAQKLAAEIFGFVQRKGGINLNVNQTNQQANVGRGGSSDDRREMASFEDITRSIAETRQRKALLPAGACMEAEFVPTPED